MDVAIVGVGLHPFGRFGDRTGIDMGAIAVRAALADAGIEWRDVQFAFAGSYEIDNPDAVVAFLGLTGIPFTNVYNGCATAGSVLSLAADTIRLGEYDLGIAIGMDKHLPGAFSSDPRLYACPSWYGGQGQFLTPKFFGMKINKVRTRRLGAFEVHSPWLPVEETPGPTVDASRAAYEKAGIGPEDVDVIQLQDTDAGAEVIHVAENGFCADGEQEKLVADGELEIGGRLPVNTDGGLLANGEPIGASGLRQVHEVVLQLRGQAGERQVPGAPKVGYTQLYGAPGVAGVSILSV